MVDNLDGGLAGFRRFEGAALRLVELRLRGLVDVFPQRAFELIVRPVRDGEVRVADSKKPEA